MMKDPYKTLNVGKDATDKDIKKSYYDKAKKLHPDANGDKENYDDSEFKETVAAYELLICPQKRKYYDETGCDMPDERSLMGKVCNIIDAMIDQFIQNFSPEDLAKKDMMADIKAALDENLKKANTLIYKATREQEKVDKFRLVFAEKLKHKKSKLEVNLFEKHLDHKEKIIRGNLNNLNEKKEIIEKAIELISDYDFEFERTFISDAETLHNIAKQLNMQRPGHPTWFHYGS